MHTDGRPTGAVRASFGYMSNLADAEAVVALVRDFFVEAAPGTAALQAEAAAAAASEPVSAQNGAAGGATAAAAAAGGATAATAAAGGAAAAVGAPLAGTPQARADVAAASSSAARPPAEPLLAAPTRQRQAAPAHPAGLGAAGCSAGSGSIDRAADGLQHSAAASVACSGSSSSTAGGCRLAGLWVYPIKSAAAVRFKHQL